VKGAKDNAGITNLRKFNAYASILKELQRSLDANDDPEVATQTFCEFGRGLQKH
jgi:hypothetical protein